MSVNYKVSKRKQGWAFDGVSNSRQTGIGLLKSQMH